MASRQELLRKLSEHCRERPDFADVLALVEPLLTSDGEGVVPDRQVDASAFGFVYLVKSGRHYKIGRTNAMGRREYELALQLPERATLGSPDQDR